MKQVILFRHAKTEERSLTGSDFKRDLKERGREDAKKMSLYLLAKEQLPDLILCSTSNRTRQTSEIFMKTTAYKGQVKYMEELYHASVSELMELLQKNIGAYKHIMLIGHNMGISQLANSLCSEGCTELPTSGIVLIEFKNEIEFQHGKLKTILTPKTI